MQEFTCLILFWFLRNLFDHNLPTLHPYPYDAIFLTSVFSHVAPPFSQLIFIGHLLCCQARCRVAIEHIYQKFILLWCLATGKYWFRWSDLSTLVRHCSSNTIFIFKKLLPIFLIPWIIILTYRLIWRAL